MNEIPNPTEASIKRSQLVQEAQKWLGYPSQRYAGPEQGISPEEWFDCSGFVKFALGRVDILVPENIRHTNEFFDNFGTYVQLGLQKPGDLIFFSKDGSYPSHMGIVLDEMRYINASGNPDSFVQISEYSQKPIEDSKPNALYHTNPIGFKRYATLDGRWKIT